MYTITQFNDLADLQFKLVSDPVVLLHLASLANALGFGWCGGTNTGSVGTGFDVRRVDKQIWAQAHYNGSDPYAAGYRATDRLVMIFEDISLEIDPSTIQYGKPVLTKFEPSLISTLKTPNYGLTQIEARKEFTYELTETLTHTSSFSFTEGVKIAHTMTAKVPEVAESSTTFEFTFSAEQGWSDSSSTTQGKAETSGITCTVPPKSQVDIDLFVTNTESKVSYTCTAKLAFKVTFSGFMRWSGNARVDHPSDRPTQNFTFGTDSLTACEHIVDLFDHRDQPGYSGWDWEWVLQHPEFNIASVVDFFRDGIGAGISGRFTNVKGQNVQIRTVAAYPLPPEGASVAPMLRTVAAPAAAFNHPGPHEYLHLHAPLVTDEHLGARVLEVR